MREQEVRSTRALPNFCLFAYGYREAFKALPSLDYELFTVTGERGWVGTWYSHVDDESMTPVENPIATSIIDETRVFISTSSPKGITRRWTLRLRGQLKPRPYDCQFEFGLTAAGRAKVCFCAHLFPYSALLTCHA